MKLCYMPGSCALAPHIALHWIGRPFEIWKIDRELLQDPQYLKINPLGKVPALIEDDGATLTECGAILTYLAEKFPEARLGPGEGLRARYEMNRWISHLGGNVHPAFYPFFLTARYHPDPAQHPAVKEQAQAQIYRQMDLMERQTAGRDWVLRGGRRVVDGLPSSRAVPLEKMPAARDDGVSQPPGAGIKRWARIPACGRRWRNNNSSYKKGPPLARRPVPLPLLL